MNRILLVEDAADIQKIVTRTFSHHSVSCVTTVSEAQLALNRGMFDLILLDINLPGESGYALLNEMGSVGGARDIPIICLTSKTALEEKVTAFSLGAEDYIEKPFEPMELRARVDAKLRKIQAKDETQIVQAGDLNIDLSRHRVSIQDHGRSREVAITQTEFKLLCCLAKAIDRVFTRDQLLVAAWGEDAQVNDRVVDVHLCSLRKKLGKSSKHIQAVTGVGYRFTILEQEKKAA